MSGNNFILFVDQKRNLESYLANDARKLGYRALVMVAGISGVGKDAFEWKSFDYGRKPRSGRWCVRDRLGLVLALTRGD